MSKYQLWHENITSKLVLTTVFGIHRNIFIVLPVPLKIRIKRAIYQGLNYDFKYLK